MPKKVPDDLEGFNPFAELLGLVFTRCENGESECALEVSRKFLNPHGVVHGGVAYSLADTGMGAAAWSCIDEDELCATIEIKIIYFKAVTSGTLHCRTKLLNRSRTIATFESEIVNDGRLAAKAIGTFSVFKDRNAASG
ncbi:MAG: PaaI family thioesterase [Dehalococcoidia bacterium]|nr:PaaI family thioesterase [Dehalococcoidia bacterium]